MALTTLSTVSGGDAIASTWGNAVKANFDAHAAFGEIPLPLVEAILPISGVAGAGLEQAEYGTAAPKVNAVQARFDDGTDEWLQWNVNVPRSYGTSAVMQITYYMATAVGGTVVWGACAAALGAGDTSATAKVFGTASTTAAVVPGTAVIIGTASITMADMNSAAANDWMNISLYRDADAAGDSAGGDAVVLSAKLIFNLI